MFYTQIADGQVKKFVLCEKCANEQGITNPDGLLSPGELMGVGAGAEGDSDVLPFESAEECSACGFTLEDFRKIGRMGCARCYEAFGSELAMRLPSMHKGMVHQGYLPEGLLKEQALRGKVEALEKELREAVESEDYEAAAGLRDTIQELKKGGKGGGK